MAITSMEFTRQLGAQVRKDLQRIRRERRQRERVEAERDDLLQQVKQLKAELHASHQHTQQLQTDLDEANRCRKAATDRAQRAEAHQQRQIDEFDKIRQQIEQDAEVRIEEADARTHEALNQLDGVFLERSQAQQERDAALVQLELAVANARRRRQRQKHAEAERDEAVQMLDTLQGQIATDKDLADYYKGELEDLRSQRGG